MSRLGAIPPGLARFQVPSAPSRRAMPKQVQMPVFLVAVPMRMVVKLGATLGVNQVVWWVVLKLKHFAIRDPALNQGTTLRCHCDERQDTGARAA